LAYAIFLSASRQRSSLLFHYAKGVIVLDKKKPKKKKPMPMSGKGNGPMMGY